MRSIIGTKITALLVLLTVIIFIYLSPLYFLNKKEYKILLIGLDGAGWKVMMPIIEKGNLPNIKRLIDNGCWGNLEITTSPISEIVWTSIATGKPPQIHGIISNLIKDPETNEMVPPTSNLRKAKAIWNILSEHGKKVGVVGYRVSWPAEKINGVIISERASDSGYRMSFRYSEPSFMDLCTEEIFNSFKIEINSPVALKDANWIFNRDIFMSNVAKLLLKNKEFDFFCLYLRGIDESSHYYWKYMFPEGQDISAEEVSKYKEAIEDYYIWCDSIIGDLLKIIDKNTVVMVVSDHGFKTSIDREYLFSKVDNLLEVSGLKKFSYNSKTVMLEGTPNNMWDYKKNIRIIGELSREEFNAARENAKNILKNIKIRETGQSIFKISNDTDKGFVLEGDKEEVNKEVGHHILINSQEYKVSDFLIRNPKSGDHDETDAIIIISGENIHHQRLKNANIYDIAPTLLYLSNLPVATDMYGNVLMAALNIFYKKPVRYINTYEDDKIPVFQKPIRSPADEGIIKERMRSLGYIN